MALKESGVQELRVGNEKSQPVCENSFSFPKKIVSDASKTKKSNKDIEDCKRSSEIASPILISPKLRIKSCKIKKSPYKTLGSSASKKSVNKPSDKFSKPGFVNISKMMKMDSGFKPGEGESCLMSSIISKSNYSRIISADNDVPLTEMSKPALPK